MDRNTDRLNVLIASPLEEEHVARIRAVAPDRVDVIYEPDLLPPTRYVADHSGPAGFRRNEEQEARWRRHLAQADILWDFPPDAADGSPGLSLAPKVKWIQATSSGIGSRVARLGLKDSAIVLTTAKGVHAGPLTEFVFHSLIGHWKRQLHVQAEQKRHHWDRFCGEELAGKTLAVVGVGEVGRRVIQIGKAFDMRVVALARPGSKRIAAELGVDALFGSDDLHRMLGEADALVLIIPHTAETEGMIDRAAIAAMKPGVVLVNIARGQVIDEPAMIDALRSGHIAFAALDVFAVEPLPPSSPLWDMPNVLVSPHSASTATSENGKITEIFCRNLECFVEGRLSEMTNLFDRSLTH
ncbi:D-2-hydroxyacid dehydrogenase [Inquilinus sp.]|uniref:D-2-hydroxyacid dehydrogenase n=1 Tax=Inquilinus sp. TaxID=1932117 RepID=UPI0031E0E954